MSKLPHAVQAVFSPWVAALSLAFDFVATEREPKHDVSGSLHEMNRFVPEWARRLVQQGNVYRFPIHMYKPSIGSPAELLAPRE